MPNGNAQAIVVVAAGLVVLTAALSWYQRLARLGISPLLTDSNGAGGYHLLAAFTEPVATPLVFALMRWLVSDYARYRLSGPPETFPKQPRIGAGRYGNWLRLPGRHHTRDHWSAVWDGQAWITGEAAIDHILLIDGSSPALIPVEVRSFLSPKRPAQQVKARRHVVGHSDHLTQHIQSYVSKLPNLSEGQGRDGVAYRFACWLVRDLQLADDVALRWLDHWDGGNLPPKGPERLREIIASAHNYGQRAYGSGLSWTQSRGILIPRWRPRRGKCAASLNISM